VRAGMDKDKGFVIQFTILSNSPLPIRTIPFCGKLPQSEPMQRLRRIKQLGFSEFVYPGATHSRLSHSFGAMQMARRMFEVFERNEVLLGTRSTCQRMRARTLAAVSSMT